MRGGEKVPDGQFYYDKVAGMAEVEYGGLACKNMKHLMQDFYRENLECLNDILKDARVSNSILEWLELF